MGDSVPSTLKVLQVTSEVLLYFSLPGGGICSCRCSVDLGLIPLVPQNFNSNYGQEGSPLTFAAFYDLWVQWMRNNESSSRSYRRTLPSVEAKQWWAMHSSASCDISRAYRAFDLGLLASL